MGLNVKINIYIWLKNIVWVTSNLSAWLFEGTETFFSKTLEMDWDVCVHSLLSKTEKVIQSVKKDLKSNEFDSVYIFQLEVKPSPSWRCYNPPLPNPINPKWVKSKMILNYISKSWLSPD